MSASLSCLETPAISEHVHTSHGQADFRSIAFLKSRELRRDLLIRLDKEQEHELADKLRKCGTPIVFICTACSVPHRAEQACHLKWCPVCARARAAQRCSKYEAAAALMQWPMHVTLTRTNIAAIDAADVLALKKAFKRLRRQAIWKNNVKGGIVSIELTNTGKGWHPHMHILCDAKWLAIETPEPKRWHSRARKAELCKMASEELMLAWSACIDQMLSSIRVRRCDGATAVREVLKYAVKGSDLIDSREPIGGAIRAISGGRLSTPFGTLYNLRHELRPYKKPFACPACAAIGSMIPEAVEENIRRGCRRNAHLRRGAPLSSSRRASLRSATAA